MFENPNKLRKTMLIFFTLPILHTSIRCSSIVRKFYESDDESDQMATTDPRACYKTAVQNILTGKLQDIPELPRQTVNIYVCSNYSGES